MNKLQLKIEHFLLFVIFPILLGIDIIPSAKILCSFLVLGYVIYLLLKNKQKLTRKIRYTTPRKYWKHIGLRLIPIIIFTIIYVVLTEQEQLFYVVIHKPRKWILMLFVYLIVSVIPQEIMYRHFYFYRYHHLFKNNFWLITGNALVFSLGHLFFQNPLVLLITFIGGIIFAYTYLKTKSTYWTIIEHIIYGGWLFTVGMGKMLGFPI